MSFDNISTPSTAAHAHIRMGMMRLLQPSESLNGDSSSDGNDAANGGTGSNINGGGGSGNDAYEFIAFLLWYVFLVLCCVIPTCCAYRRRRQVEARMAQHQTTMDRWQATNMFIVAGGFRTDNAEHVQAHRTKYLQQELKATTMVRVCDVNYCCCYCCYSCIVVAYWLLCMYLKSFRFLFDTHNHFLFTNPESPSTLYRWSLKTI
jgi:hypothetical protein